MPRPRRRRLAWLVLPAGLALVLWAIQSDVAGRLAAEAAEAAAERALGEDVTIGRVEVSYLPPHVEVQGLVVTHRPTGEVVAAASAVRLQPGLDGLRPVLRRLVLERPSVTLHLDADGLREFRNVPKATGRTADAFPWEELHVADGSFSLVAEGGGIDVRGVSAGPGAAPGTTDVSIAGVELRAGALVQRAADVRFPGVVVAPDHLAVPAVDLRFDAFSVEGNVAAAKAGPLGGDLSLHAALPKLTRKEGDLDWVDGEIDVDVNLSGTAADPGVAGALATRGVVIWDSDGTKAKARRIGDAEGRWALEMGDAPKVHVDPLRMAWGDGTLGVRGTVDVREKTVDGVVLAEGISLARILAEAGVSPTPWVDLRGDVELHATGTLSPLRIAGPFEIAVAGFEVHAGPVEARTDTILAVPQGSLQGDFLFDKDHLVIDGQRVVAGLRSGAHSVGRARAEVGFKGWGPLAVDVDFERLDLSQLRPLGDAGLGGIAKLQGFVGGRFDGTISAEGTIEAVDVRALDLAIADTMTATLGSADMKRVHLAGIEARLGDTEYAGEFDLAFVPDMSIDTAIDVRRGRIHDLAGIFLDIGPADGAVRGSARLAGGPYTLDGDVHLALADVDLYGERFPSGEAVGWMDGGEFTLGNLTLLRGEEALVARGSVKRGFAMNVEVLSDGVTLQGLDLLRPLDVPLAGDLHVDAQVGGTLFEPEPRGRIAALRASYGGEPMGDSVLAFSTTGGVLTYGGSLVGDGARVDGTLGLWGEQPYAVTARLQRFPVHLLRPVGEDGSPILATLSGDLSLGGHFGDDPTPVDIVGRFDEATLAWSGHVLSAPEPWSFEVHGRQFEVPPLRLVGNDGSAFSFEGFADGRGRLALKGEGKLDLDLARMVVPELQEARGTGDVTFRFERDAAGAPDTRVTLRTRGATLRTGYFPHAFEGLSTKVEASADGYRIGELTAEVGGGRFRGKPSTIHARDWVPVRYELAGSLEDATVRYLDYLPPLTGDADLRFDGPVADLLLSGRIEIERMDFRDRVDWEAMVLSLREERLTQTASEAAGRYFSMDLEVVADETVHFRNNVADADASARLRIVGDTSRPGMVGEIHVTPGGQVYLHEREFEVTRGELRYVDPYTYDPDLDIVLETDVRSHEQDYHLNYTVSGPFSDWRTSTSSDPWLAQADVNALLLFGVTREELEQYGGLGTALVAETSDLLLAQTALTRMDLRLIDRWSLVSGVSERGSSVVSSELRLVAEKELEGFDITVEKGLGRDWGQDWYASVERRVARRLYATAYVATRQEGRSLPIGAAYGAEFKFRWELD